MWFASEIQSQYKPLADEYPVILTLTYALQQTMHVVQTAVRTSLRDLPQGLALLFQPVAMVQPLGFQASRTIVQKFLTVRKDKILESQKITGDQLCHSPFWIHLQETRWKGEER